MKNHCITPLGLMSAWGCVEGGEHRENRGPNGNIGSRYSEPTSLQPSLGGSRERDLGNLCISVSQSVLMNINTCECGLSLIIACNVIFLMKIKSFSSTK